MESERIINRDDIFQQENLSMITCGPISAVSLVFFERKCVRCKWCDGCCCWFNTHTYTHTPMLIFFQYIAMHLLWLSLLLYWFIFVLVVVMVVC